MAVNHSTLSNDDTLQLTLHVADPTLKSGTVDFNDSTVVTLKDLKPVLDTMLVHFFKSTGSFDITVSFTDGDSITTKHLIIAVSDPSPKVTLVPNKTTCIVGDTLKVTLHASDATLSNGSVDFKDGTVISFFNLNCVFDTTIVHVYSYFGTYSVTATFSDGYTSTSVSVPIATTGYDFALSFSVGMVWRFSYSFSDHEPPFSIADHQSGIHEWRIISFIVVNQDTTFTVQQIKNDTRHYQGSIDSRWVDTTYAINDTTQFRIVLSYSSIQFDWPIGSGIRTDTIPNHTFVNRYPYSVAPVGGGGPVTYYDNQGPIRYSYHSSTMHSISYDEDLSLIDFTKP
jgi:hypothetical protein